MDQQIIAFLHIYDMAVGDCVAVITKRGKSQLACSGPQQNPAIAGQLHQQTAMHTSIGALGPSKEKNVVGWLIRQRGCTYPSAVGDAVPHRPHGCQPVVFRDQRVDRELLLICQTFPDKPDQPAVSR
ncbi:hypothetical protein D3C84_611980 [compost metagenome]